LNRTIVVNEIDDFTYQSSKRIYDSIPSDFFNEDFKIGKEILDMKSSQIEDYTFNVTGF
jgi:hypothetical protein